VKLGEIGEFGLIGRIESLAGESPQLLLGIGDDAAALLPTPGTSMLSTSDMLLEGVHFDLSYTDPRSLGRKSLAVNLSDIAAMGAVPRFFLLSIALPPSTEVGFVDFFAEGLMETAGRYGATLVGGDTCSSRSGIVISITLLGEQTPERIVRRSGAGPGDTILVTGTLGDSATGLRLLREGERRGEAVRRHLDPTPRVEAGRLLAEAGIPTAMIDVSDGLLADLGHILDASGRGAEIFLDRLPLSDEYLAAAFPGSDFYRNALSGGEDYELLFTAPPSREREIREIFASLSLPVTSIGIVTSGRGIRIFTPDGTPASTPAAGFDHFGGN
jgi:thiamine-monophosphate kinase